MNAKYKAVWLHVPSAVFSAALCLSVCTLVTMLNPIMTKPDWVKEGENFVLFFCVLFAGLLYAFSVIEVFKTGQEAWKKLVSAVRAVEKDKGSESDVDEILRERPDYFLSVVAVLAWAVLAYCSVSLQVPTQMLPLLFAVNLLLLLPVVLAFDYWGFKSGIKRVEKN